MQIRELSYADDCVVVAQALEEIMLIMFDLPSGRFGLTINVKKNH